MGNRHAEIMLHFWYYLSVSNLCYELYQTRLISRGILANDSPSPLTEREKRDERFYSTHFHFTNETFRIDKNGENLLT